MSLTFDICPQCHQPFTAEAGHINRARKAGAPVYCGRSCSGLARRKLRSDDEKRAMKAAYDAKRRSDKAEGIRKAKADYYQRTRDPVKEARKRKERMPRHVEYCRQPEYRAWKAKYDQEYCAKQEFGEFWESAILALEIRRECLALADDTEIRRQAGTQCKWESGGKTHLVVYADRLAQGLPTVCDGLTRHVTTTPIIVGQRWTAEKCAAEEQAAMLRVQQQLLPCFTRLPPQTVFDAASSHAWNVGAPNTCASGAMTAWNAGQWERGCQRIALSDSGRPVWSSVRTGRTLPNGKPEFRFLQGLFNRREDEVHWCLTGVIR